jgi:hypothetical protein
LRLSKVRLGKSLCKVHLEFNFMTKIEERNGTEILSHFLASILLHDLLVLVKEAGFLKPLFFFS